jgi:hypothetical protein
MNLQKFGVQELSVQEQEEIQGGSWFNFIRFTWNSYGFHCYVGEWKIF